MTDPYDPAVREVNVRVGRSARVALAGGSPDGLREAWYLLHGYGQLARRFLDRFTAFARPDRLLVAPEGLSRFYVRPGDADAERARHVGASWMTREDREREIDDYVEYLNGVVGEVEGVGERAPSRTVLGFSQGAHTAVRWVTRGRIPATRVVLWGAALPEDLSEDAGVVLGAIRILLVRGANDPLRSREAEARDEAWLASAGVSYEIREHPGAHEIDDTLLAELAEEG